MASGSSIRPGNTRASYFLSRWLFLRLLGVIYLIAFLSVWCQIDGLIGSNGILPAEEFHRTARAQLGIQAYWKLPTLCWLSASDAMLHGLCVSGCSLAIMLIVGVAPIPVLLLLWTVYLSLVVDGQAFLSFQWDILLLETGFLAIFLAPACLLPRPSRERPPLASGVVLLHWLLFKLIFLSGVTKLLSGDAAWWQLTALDVHYETQPLPIWIAWYAHQLPHWFQQTCVAIMFIIEMGVPFLIFTTRYLRVVACAALVLLQLLIAATGNYCFFNVNTMLLCVLLLDDHVLRRLAPSRWTTWIGQEHPVSLAALRLRRMALIPIFLLFVVSGLTFIQEMVQTHQGAAARKQDDKLPTSIAVSLNSLDRYVMSWAQPVVLKWITPFRTISGYGLFRVMTMERPEIIVEASRNGREWVEYPFRWKPGDLAGRPRFNTPHQPRLDWQMWFAALNPGGNTYWLERFLQRLLEGSPSVQALLGDSPFAGQPPRYVRLVYYRYHFTNWESDHATGNWWQREKLGNLSGPVSLDAFGRRPDGK